MQRSLFRQSLAYVVLSLYCVSRPAISQTAVTDADFIADKLAVGTWKGTLQPYQPTNHYRYDFSLTLELISSSYSAGLKGVLRLESSTDPKAQGNYASNIVGHFSSGALGFSPPPEEIAIQMPRHVGSGLCMAAGILKTSSDGSISGSLGMNVPKCVTGKIRFAKYGGYTLSEQPVRTNRTPESCASDCFNQHKSAILANFLAMLPFGLFGWGVSKENNGISRLLGGGSSVTWANWFQQILETRYGLPRWRITKDSNIVLRWLQSVFHTPRWGGLLGRSSRLIVIVPATAVVWHLLTVEQCTINCIWGR